MRDVYLFEKYMSLGRSNVNGIHMSFRDLILIYMAIYRGVL